MSSDQRTANQGIGAGEVTEEFLVSSPGLDPLVTANRLAQLVKAVETVDDVSIVNTVGGEKTLKVVVLSSTPASLKKVAASFPDLTIEKNQPLELFGPAG